MKKKRVIVVGVLLALVGLGAAVAWTLWRQHEDKALAQSAENHYGIVVRSTADADRAAKQHDAYLRRAQRLRAEFQPFAEQNQTKITATLAKGGIPTLLPRDPEQLLPHWKEISDTLSPDELQSRASDALVFTWNAPMPSEDHPTPVHPLRHNFPVAESLMGKNAIVFWLDGSITEESRFGPAKTTLSAKPLQELAPPYDFFKKGH